MKLLTSSKIVSVSWAFQLLLAISAFGQTQFVKDEGIVGPLHQANVSKIVFTPKSIPVQSLKETDFLKAIELNETNDLAFTAFMENSLTNYLHQLAPGLSVNELNENGSYQFSFFVDGVLIQRYNVHPAAIPSENKITKTTLGASFISSSDPESRWGPTWHRFLLNGGEQALSAGKHSLRLELRPYLQTTELQVGNPIAAGELQLTVIKPKVDENLTKIRPIAAGSGWAISNATYNKTKIEELNRKVLEKFYKDIKSIVVIKNGKLLIEEYFNGADRNTLHDTRSVGKSFASTMAGIAINDGYIKSENQTLKDFYDLKSFANYSPKKETVTLKHLLTMSSGFNGNDDDEDSPGNEEKMYPTSNWVKFALDVPMDEKTDVGEKWRYFTAGVIILGDIIHKSVPGGLERYSDEKLFKPLGITRYKWQYTPQKVASTAGQLSMSALDLAKYGQLYRNGGRWEGKQIVPQSWVEKTSAKQVRRGPGDDEYYGYLFWHTTFNVAGKHHEVFLATGNGGNKIFVFKDQPLVIVVTATAFGQWYMHQQVDNMMTRYILPAVLNSSSGR